jgi:hypothetical protein
MSSVPVVHCHETTASMISLSTVAFLRNPEQLAMIKADPGNTLNAVEEMLRYFTIIDVATARLCVEDIKVGGQLIRAAKECWRSVTGPTAARGRSGTRTSSTSSAARATTLRSGSGRTSASART